MFLYFVDFSTNFPTSVEIPNGADSVEVTLKALDDNLIEEALETVTLSFTATDNPDFLQTDISASSTLTDNDKNQLKNLWSLDKIKAVISSL